MKKQRTNINFQIDSEEYQQFQEISKQLGGISISALMRIIASNALKKVNEEGDPSRIFGFNSDK